MLKAMKGIYANIVWYAIIVYGLVGAAVHRHSSADWEGMADARMNYDLVFGGLALYLIVSAVGLMLKRKWGYLLAVSANATLALAPMAVLIASLVIVFPALSVIEVLQSNLVNLVLGVVSLGFWIWIVKSNIKVSYLGQSHVIKG